MLRSLQRSKLDRHSSTLNLTTNPPLTFTKPYAEFTEVRVHTAKCDSCDKHNKLTMYRCLKTGQHVCSLCWKKSRDRMHVFGGGSFKELDMNSNTANGNKSADGEKRREDATRTRTRKRVPIISDDEDDVFVLTPASTTGKAKTVDASKQHQETNNTVMNNGHYHDHEDESPELWPMVPASRPSVLRPAAYSSATESVKSTMQINDDVHEDEIEPERHGMVRNHENPGRQPIPGRRIFVDDLETNHQARRPSQSYISKRQAAHSAHSYAQPAIYRPRPGVDVDRQAARYQHLFTDSLPKIHQALCQAQHTPAYQQAPRQIRPDIYRLRPGIEVRQQAARTQPTFVDHRHPYHQAPQIDQASVSRQQAAYSGRRPAQASFYISERDGQIRAPTDLEAVRNPQASYLNQQAQAFANVKLMKARNRHALSSHQNARLAVNRDRLAVHNHQAFISNQLSPSAADCGNSLAARDQQQAYLARQQAFHPPPSSAQASLSHGFATSSFRLPAQDLRAQQHASPLASYQGLPRTITQGRPNGPSAGTQAQEVCLPLSINQRRSTDSSLSIYQKYSKQPMPFSSMPVLTETRNIRKLISVPRKI